MVALGIESNIRIEADHQTAARVGALGCFAASAAAHPRLGHLATLHEPGLEGFRVGERD